MNGDIEMSPAEEDLRDAMKDEAAFDGAPIPPVSGRKLGAPTHDHMNPDGTEQPVSALLNINPGGEHD